MGEWINGLEWDEGREAGRNAEETDAGWMDCTDCMDCVNYMDCMVG